MGEIFFNVYAVIVMFLLFGLTIFVHEFGHFITAIKLGLVVETFSIGFGPSIWKKKHKGVLYKIGIIPFGGYVAIPQLDPAGMEGIQGKDGKDDDAEEKKEPKNYPEVAYWKKIIVSASGAFFNVLLAVLFAWIIYLHPGAITGEKKPLIMRVDETSVAYTSGLRTGQEILSVEGEKVDKWQDFIIECHLNSGATNLVQMTVKSGNEELLFTVPTEKAGKISYIMGVFPFESPPCRVGRVFDGTPAEKAGVKAGDVIDEIDGTNVENGEHLKMLISKSGEKEVALKIRRNGKPMTIMVTPRMNEEYEQPMIGVQYAEDLVPDWMAYKKPGDQLSADGKAIWRILRALTSRKEGVAKQAAGALGGPPRIFQMLWLSIKLSLLSGLGFVRFLNINLAILNMLPIPVLDGGHIVFALYEGVIRRKPHPKVINTLVNIFVVLLIGVMLLLSSRDIIDMVSAHFSKDQVEEVEEEGGRAIAD